MALSKEILEEINVLIQFRYSTTQEGIKVHSTATQSTINATKRLHAKGMITQADGGYLTFAGRETAEHAMALNNMLTMGEAQDIHDISSTPLNIS